MGLAKRLIVYEPPTPFNPICLQWHGNTMNWREPFQDFHEMLVSNRLEISGSDQVIKVWLHSHNYTSMGRISKQFLRNLKLNPTPDRQVWQVGQSGSWWVGESLELVASIRRDWLKRPICRLPIENDLLLISRIFLIATISSTILVNLSRRWLLKEASL